MINNCVTITPWSCIFVFEYYLNGVFYHAVHSLVERSLLFQTCLAKQT